MTHNWISIVDMGPNHVCTSQLWDKIWANLARPNFTSYAVSANFNQSYLHIHDPGLSA